jgi:hypothetical protein
MGVLAAFVSLGLASHPPRRAWASIAVFAWFLITFIVSGVLTVEVGGLGRYSVFFAPFQFIHGFTLWVFNKSPEVGSPLHHANFPFWVYPVTVLAYATAGVAIVIRRFDRIPA